MTAADTRVGDADVSGRSEDGVTTPPFVWGYPPFLGRRAYGRSGVSRETRGRRAGWVPESGRTDLGIPEETGVLAWKVLSARNVLPARKA